MLCTSDYVFRSVFQLFIFSGFISAEGFAGQVKNIELIDVVEWKSGNLKVVSRLGFKVRSSGE